MVKLIASFCSIMNNVFLTMQGRGSRRTQTGSSQLFSSLSPESWPIGGNSKGSMRYSREKKREVCDQTSSISTPLCLGHYQRGPLDLNQPLLPPVRWPAVMMTEPLSLWQKEAKFIRPVQVIVKSYRFSHVAKCVIHTAGQQKPTVNCAVYCSQAAAVQCNDDGQ